MLSQKDIDRQFSLILVVVLFFIILGFKYLSNHSTIIALSWVVSIIFSIFLVVYEPNFYRMALYIIILILAVTWLTLTNEWAFMIGVLIVVLSIILCDTKNIFFGVSFGIIWLLLALQSISSSS